MRGSIAIAFMLFGLSELYAASKITEKILAMSEPSRNSFLGHFLEANGEECDLVVKTMFQGTRHGADSWSIGCRDGNEYAVDVLDDGDKHEILTCKRLEGIIEMAKAAGEKTEGMAAGWVKF